MPHRVPTPTVRAPILRPTSRGLDAGKLTRGAERVLEVAPHHAIELPEGVALEDGLDATERSAVDHLARRHYGSWRAARAGTLTVAGLDLAELFELELLARCFLPAALLERTVPAGTVAEGFAAGPAGVLAALGADVRAGAPPPEAPFPRRPPSWPARGVARLGVPARARGEVVCVGYWHLEPVFARLAADRGPRPVAAGVALPGLGLLAAVRAAARGGWIGHPSARARGRARRVAERSLAGVSALGGGALAAALDRWALDELRGLAGDAVARAERARVALGRGAVRLVLLPHDGPEDSRAWALVSRAAGVPTLLVQHGFDARLGVPDKGHVDVVALWSERNRETVPAGSAARVEVTGNPGAEHLARPARRARGRERSIVLVDYPSRVSLRVPARIRARHVATALAALAAARPGSTAVVRPHPADRESRAYARLGNERLRIEVDTGTPIERLLASADLCIGSLSTATLQAAAAGVPVVMLDLTGSERPWPFDGTALPVARGESELVERVHEAAAAPGVVGEEAAREALGARPGATNAVCELIAELVTTGAGPPG
jgi:hypothetical protein